jgi:GT2 family glycosyltransferase
MTIKLRHGSGRAIKRGAVNALSMLRASEGSKISTAEPTFSIVVPTFERLDRLGRTITTLLDTRYPADRFEIIVVDDGSNPRTQAVVEAACPDRGRIRLLDGSRRGGAAARNLGASQASGDFLVFMDDDILVQPQHLTAALEAFDLHGDCIVGGDWTFLPEVSDQLSRSPLGRYRLAVERSYRSEPPTGRWSFPRGLPTAHITVRRDHFWDIGGFDEALPGAGCEDWAFCLRAHEAGYKLVHDHELLLLHNDTHITLPRLCTREERRGISVGVLARMRREAYGDTDVVRENSPIRPSDSWILRMRKTVKRLLSTGHGTAALQAVAPFVERIVRPERFIYRFYKAVIAVYYFRGFRTGFSEASEPPRRP